MRRILLLSALLTGTTHAASLTVLADRSVPVGD